jgi:hypothetical protein
MVSELKNTAAPQVAGYILQLERALFHLARAEAGVSVAVEYVDDVSLSRAGRTILQEQDKHSTEVSKEIFGDRSKALWRTLQIWLTQRRQAEGSLCERYLIVSNTHVGSPIADLIKGTSMGTRTTSEVVAALRSAGAARSRAKIQQIIDDVLSYNDEILEDLIIRIEIVDRFEAGQSYLEIANGLAIDPRMDVQVILDALLGWLTRILRVAWQLGQPGMISRDSCIRQCREIERLQARQRFLPRPASHVVVADVDRTRALARPFVSHLNRIEADDEDVLQAVEHFIQFNVEKHRLAGEGEVPDGEWRDRSERLRQRWRNISRSARREHAGSPHYAIGQKILTESTYHHLEPLSLRTSRRAFSP